MHAKEALVTCKFGPVTCKFGLVTCNFGLVTCNYAAFALRTYFEGKHLSSYVEWRPRAGNACWRGRLSTVNLLNKLACFVKKK